MLFKLCGKKGHFELPCRCYVLHMKLPCLVAIYVVTRCCDSLSLDMSWFMNAP